MTIFSFDSGPCGSGKTERFIHRTAHEAGRTMVAGERKELLGELESRLRHAALRAGMNPIIITIVSTDNPEDASWTRQRVRSTIEAMPRLHGDKEHVIVLITHEGLKSADLSAFTGWHLVIDETPTIFDSEPITTPVLAEHFAAKYDLGEPTEFGWRMVTAKPGTATTAGYARTAGMERWQVFHRRVESERTEVFVNLPDWSAMTAEDAQWTWHSLWTADELTAFDSVTVLANAFDRSVTYHLFRNRWPEIHWQRLDTDETRAATARRFKLRLMTIKYFAEAHIARANLWRSKEGEAYHAKIADWLKANVDKDRHIITTNKSLVGRFCDVPGDHLSPRQAGVNRYMGRTQATMIFSSKVGPQEQPVFEAMGITGEMVQATRETETMIQFACRIAVRDPDSTEHLTLHVYDREQAEALAEYFESTGYVSVKLELVDLGFAWVERDGKPGPKLAVLTPEEAEARDLERKRIDRERKKAERHLKKAADEAAGIIRRPRGRPKKSDRPVEDHELVNE